MGDGELKKRIKLLRHEAVENPNHEIGRLHVIELFIDEAKKEYWSLIKIDRDYKGQPMRMTLPDPIKLHKFFEKWFGDIERL